MPEITLSDEQKEFISLALSGANVLVDACIGSGKTTSIQKLCDEMPMNRILYLTYNKLLKDDAREKILNRNVDVHNYHSFARTELMKIGRHVSPSDAVQIFNKVKPTIMQYDVLMIDEYQDIEEELANLLWIIKEQNPDIQIIAVGDMCQKIYDKTTLNVPEFIDEYLDDYESVQFTQCFRLNNPHASMLGRIWNKSIKGVNKAQKTRIMDPKDITKFLSTVNTGELLCLGSRKGYMQKTLNYMEEHYPEKYNKKTVYASIRDNDKGNIYPDKDTAIFTTFDSSKGLERDICVIFDFTPSFWKIRSSFDGVKYEILRNIFLVAASRGKKEIIFVLKDEPLLDEDTLSEPFGTHEVFDKLEISTMFDFKYKEDIEACYKLLTVTDVSENKTPIQIARTDEMIDLSPCVGIYQEASYFEGYDIESQIEFAINHTEHALRYTKKEDDTIQDRVLALTAIMTGYDRYKRQVETPFIDDDEVFALEDRLGTEFTPKETVQGDVTLTFSDRYGKSYVIPGRYDVLKDNVVWELKFVDELSHENALQAATYAVAMGLKKAMLWNTRTNQKLEITIPSKKKFLNAVINCVTKGVIDKDYSQNKIA